MLIHYDPDMYVTVHDSHRCPYHEKHPGEMGFAGCTCSFSSTQRLRSPEEYAAIKAKKLREEEDRILARAELIKASRGLDRDTGA